MMINYHYSVSISSHSLNISIYSSLSRAIAPQRSLLRPSRHGIVTSRSVFLMLVFANIFLTHFRDTLTRLQMINDGVYGEEIEFSRIQIMIHVSQLVPLFRMMSLIFFVEYDLYPALTVAWADCHATPQVRNTRRIYENAAQK